MSNDLAGCTFVLRKAMIRFLIVSIVFAIGLGCSNLGSHEHRPDAVIWEAWEGIKDSHVDSAALSVDVLMDGGIKEMLNLANIPAYPLLTELDEVIDRPPKQVSKELEDNANKVDFSSFSTIPVKFKPNESPETVIAKINEEL